MFRHACAYNLLKNGMNIHAVMRYLGHESITVLQNYLTDADSEYASELHDEFSPLRVSDALSAHEKASPVDNMRL